MIKARTKVGVADITVCIVALILVVILLLVPSGSSSNTVYVKTDDSEFYIDLSENTTKSVTSNGHTLSLEIKDGEVRVTDSDCPDKLCEKVGWIKDSSQIIVCAPAKVLIRIQSPGGESDADFIAGR